MRGYHISLSSALIIAALCVAADPHVAMAQHHFAVQQQSPAPVGHAQPTPDGFLSDQNESPDEQQRLSNFDAEQHRMDQQLDKSLNICRC